MLKHYFQNYCYYNKVVCSHNLNIDEQTLLELLKLNDDELPKDLIKKIDFLGLKNKPKSEVAALEESLVETDAYLKIISMKLNKKDTK